MNGAYVQGGEAADLTCIFKGITAPLTSVRWYNEAENEIADDDNAYIINTESVDLSGSSQQSTLKIKVASAARSGITCEGTPADDDSGESNAVTGTPNLKVFSKLVVVDTFQ